MRIRFSSTGSRVILTTVAIALASGPAALADHSQPAPDIEKMDYAPIGHFKPGEPTPAPTDFDTKLKPEMDGPLFNPSGKYNAFDTNVFEVLGLPYRAAGDTSASDPYGNGGDPRHGYCDSDADPDLDTDRGGPLAPVVGECPNHQLEYSRYFAATMRDILGDYGVSIRRYRFMNPGGENTQSGTAINTAAVVPGADHPEETVIIGAHFDQTDEGPASAWDSAEGHAQVIRIAKIMADYWKSTGTRPSATVKFVPWDAEESGTLGSADYAANNIVPGEEDKVRGYWNTDPCAGGYPAYRFGNPEDRVDLGIQVANPDRLDDQANLGDSTNPPEEARARIEAFNAKVPGLVEAVFEHLDDTLTVRGQNSEIFIASSEAAEGEGDIGNDVLIQNSRPVLFSSDWKNFENLGIPFFNPGPDVTGPSSQLEYGNLDGLGILHTPNDNLQTLNAYTSDDPTGQKFSEGWIKGMEMCAHLLGWGMLQESQGGGQDVNGDVVAYYEALPNEATEDKPVRFNADGSYQYASAAGAGFVDESLLEYNWDFGDGASGVGKRLEHTYADSGPFDSTLTVRNTLTGQSDTMKVPVTVTPGANPQLAGPELTAPDSDPDGNFTLTWSRVGGEPDNYVVEESTAGGEIFSDDAEGDIAERWTVEKTGSSRMLPWQNARAGQAPKTPAGDKRHSSESSYWSGIQPSDPPAAGESTMTLKDSISVPAGSEPSLSYWSYYRNDLTDVASVEVAVDDGDQATPPDWSTVDAILGDNEVAYLPGVDVAVNGEAAQTEEMAQRRVDLSRYAGQKILLRFRNNLTSRNGVFVQRYGWYVDDIVVEADDFAVIGETGAESFEVAGRADGEYAYRVRGVYEDGQSTAPSNTERTSVVTVTEPEPVANTSGQPSPGGDGPCTEASKAATPEGDGHDHAEIAQHRFQCRVEQVAFDSLRDELGDRDDLLLGEMDVKADKAVIATSYPEAGFLLFDVADPSKPRFLSWYRSSECEGLVLDVDCGAYSWLSDDGTTVLLSTQNTTAIPGDFPQPGLSGVAKPLTVPGVEVVDVSRPEMPVLSQTYVPASGVGGTHTSRSHVIPAGPENPSRAPGEYVFSVANGIGIEISKLNSLPGGDKLTPVHTIELEEAHDTFVQNDPITDRTYLYVAAGFSTGFLVYDVTDPADPVKLADWDLTPECGEDWYSHTIDVAVRNGRRYLTMPVELIDMDLFGDQSAEDQAAGCGRRVGNGEQAGPLWIVDVTDFSALGQEGDSDDELRRKSQQALVATWVNPEGQAGRNLLFSPHNQQIVGDKIYLSAYHAGIYVLDASAAFAGKNERPSELGFVVPSGEPTRPFVDQEAGPLIPFVGSFAFVRPNIWDMYVYKGYILTGDMTGGFYSFQYEGDKAVKGPKGPKGPKGDKGGGNGGGKAPRG